MRVLVHTLRLLALAASLLASALPAHAEEPIKVVYHLNTGLEQASDALRNIRNHLSTDPKVKIAVVTHARGIDFLLAGAEDKDKNPYHVIVEDLVSQGVEFKVCNITLERRKIDRSKVIPEAKIVPSGVGEVSRLQAREGYAYLKP